MKSVVVDTSAYDWEGDQPLGHDWRDTIVYEAHLRGFTADPSSGRGAGATPGPTPGSSRRSPYLARPRDHRPVELLPVFAFDRLAAPAGQVNYWGYQPVGFFAPQPAYASGPGPDGGRR